MSKMKKKKREKPEKGTPDHKAGLRLYRVMLWRNPEPIEVMAWDKAEADGIVAKRLVEWRKAENFVQARRLIQHTRVAEKKKTREKSRPLW